MIGDVLEALRAKLQDFLRTFEESAQAIVSLGDGATLESAATGASPPGSHPHVLITLVSTREDPHLRTRAGPPMEPNPSAPLVLDLLFRATASDYGTALNDLARVIRYLQTHPTVRLEATQGRAPARPVELRLTLPSLDFEQVAALWGSLGGTQVPLVICEVRLLEV